MVHCNRERESVCRRGRSKAMLNRSLYNMEKRPSESLSYGIIVRVPHFWAANPRQKESSIHPRSHHGMHRRFFHLMHGPRRRKAVGYTVHPTSSPAFSDPDNDSNVSAILPQQTRPSAPTPQYRMKQTRTVKATRATF